MFDALAAVNARPAAFSRYTTADLWTDPHISERMLAAHLDPDVDRASYRRDFVERSVAWLTDRFDIGPGTRVADFGCGPGQYTNRLARTGADVTGLDIAERSLRHAEESARREGLAVTYLRQDYLAPDAPGPFDLVLMVMRDYCALSANRRATLLGAVSRRLADGGAFVLDVDSPAAFAAVREQASYAPSLMDGFWSAEPYFGFHNTYRYDNERVSLDKFVIVERERQRVFYNWVQYFSPETLAAELATHGFRVLDVSGDLAGTPYEVTGPCFAVVAEPVPSAYRATRHTAPAAW